jgi:hypothetical protein
MDRRPHPPTHLSASPSGPRTSEVPSTRPQGVSSGLADSSLPHPGMKRFIGKVFGADRVVSRSCSCSRNRAPGLLLLHRGATFCSAARASRCGRPMILGNLQSTGSDARASHPGIHRALLQQRRGISRAKSRWRVRPHEGRRHLPRPAAGAFLRVTVGGSTMTDLRGGARARARAAGYRSRSGSR